MNIKQNIQGFLLFIINDKEKVLWQFEKKRLLFNLYIPIVYYMGLLHVLASSETY